MVFWDLLKMIELCINLDVSFYFSSVPPVTLEQMRKLYQNRGKILYNIRTEHVQTRLKNWLENDL